MSIKQWPQKPRPPEGGNPAAASHVALEDRRSDWRQALRARVIELGIRAIWGKSAFPVTMAAGIPLVSTGLRFAWLKTLGAFGLTRFVTTSGLGHKFVCHIGDLAEFPFYHRRAFQHELAICAAWLDGEAKPIVFDVGANVGFFCTHLAQMVVGQTVQIYAFEPVGHTFVKLVQSIDALNLADRVHPIAAAVLDEQRPLRLQYSRNNSLCAQVATQASSARTGTSFVHAVGTTLDAFHVSSGAFPALIKIDVEGYEVAVLRGAQGMLSRPDRPALSFEYYPELFQQYGVDPDSFQKLLSEYALYHIDDFEGETKPFGCPIGRLGEIHGACNLFAVPLEERASARWMPALAAARQRIQSRR